MGHVHTGTADVSQYYRVLGVAPTASTADVRRAFRTLVRHYHPDANPAARPSGELSAVVDAYRRIGRRGGAPAAPRRPAYAQPVAAAQRHIDVYA